MKFISYTGKVLPHTPTIFSFIYKATEVKELIEFLFFGISEFRKSNFFLVQTVLMVAFKAKEIEQVSGLLVRACCQRQKSVGNEMIGREKG